MSWEWAENLFDKILALLPTSPFRNFIDNIPNIPYLSWLNWFFPISEVLIVMSAWLLAVALFYVYSIIMRWIKLIGD